MEMHQKTFYQLSSSNNRPAHKRVVLVETAGDSNVMEEGKQEAISRWMDTAEPGTILQLDDHTFLVCCLCNRQPEKLILKKSYGYGPCLTPTRPIPKKTMSRDYDDEEENNEEEN